MIDADIVAYRIASKNEQRYNWGADEETGEEITTVIVNDPKDVEAQVHETIQEYLAATQADDFLICLSDDNYNWRKKVLPSYKQNRKESIRPELLYPLKEFMYDQFPSARKDTLEADDVMGIYSTHPKLIAGRKIIVSEDKDMKTIPGWLWNPSKDLKPRLVSLEEADLFHMQQTLTGDTTDGYKGCPGAGKGEFDKIAASPFKLVPYEHTFKRGVRAGETEIRFRKEPCETIWEAIVSQYEAKGLTEYHAITQARVARILRHTDFDYKKKEVILWQPPVTTVSTSI